MKNIKRNYKNLCLGFDHAVGVAFPLVDYGDLLCLRVDKYVETVPQPFHLYTCILRIHGFEIKLLFADDLDILFIKIAALHIFALERCRLLMTLDQFALVLLELPLDNLLHKVD